MNKIEFTVLGEPFGKQRPQFAKRGNFVTTRTPQKTVNYETLVQLSYMEKYKKMYFDVDEPLCITIRAFKSPPSSGVSKKKRLAMLQHKIFPTKKPDWDNIGKIIGDSLNSVAYPDDKQIVDAHIYKRYSENPRVEVEIYSLLSEEE